MDLDGNDYYFVEKLLSSGATPKTFIVEYNARFIPLIKLNIDYNDEHKWIGDDYFGASLTCFSTCSRGINISWHAAISQERMHSSYKTNSRQFSRTFRLR